MLVARAAQPLPVEVVVRGYITGVTTHVAVAAVRRRRAHRSTATTSPTACARTPPCPRPIVTPTTKAEHGGHDEPLTLRRRRSNGPRRRRRCGARSRTSALELFARGQELAAAAGLILADTKYEFGLTADGELLLIDEVHTPDSSRYWVADTYEDRLAAGEEPESLDKEVVRRALIDAGYDGDGDAAGARRRRCGRRRRRATSTPTNASPG